MRETKVTYRLPGDTHATTINDPETVECADNWTRVVTEDRHGKMCVIQLNHSVPVIVQTTGFVEDELP
jgi:uncharacterized protein YjiK